MAITHNVELTRAEGSTKPLRFQIAIRTSAATIQAVDLTSSAIYLYVRDSSGAILTEFNALDITASITDALNGTIDHYPTVPQITEMTPDKYTWQLKETAPASDVEWYPSDKVEGLTVKEGLLEVLENKAP